MKILYVGKHAQAKSNDDEGAIAHALEELGHTVWCLQESRADQDVRKYTRADLCLFHHWDGVEEIKYLRRYMRVVFWYFDLIDFPDPTLTSRNSARKAWMDRIRPHVDMGFCTDGDWVAKRSGDGLPRLRWLMQGADERVMGRMDLEKKYDILFTGIDRKGGMGRERFVNHMKNTYRERFHHITNGCHRESLRNTIGHSRLVVAPNSPITNLYWSNRVYLSLGFGACMLHPWCDRLMDHYTHGEEILFYTDLKDMDIKIEMLCANPEKITQIGEAGYLRTVQEHTYRHRVESLLKQVLQEPIYG